MEKLTAKQIKFCQHYVIDLNATQAAIRAGYSETSARAVSSRLLTNANIQKYISELQADLERTSGITKLKVLNAFAGIAFSNIADYHNSWIDKKDFDSIPDTEKAAIQEISSKVIRKNTGSSENPLYADIEFVKIKLYDRVQALSKISEMLGYNLPTKIDLTTDFEKMSDADIKKLALQVLELGVEKSKI